eukprot:scaffold20871_cov104-Skeletonema_marinoi.AAC.2
MDARQNARQKMHDMYSIQLKPASYLPSLVLTSQRGGATVPPTGSSDQLQLDDDAAAAKKKKKAAAKKKRYKRNKAATKHKKAKLRPPSMRRDLDKYCLSWKRCD